jgi:transposase
MDNDPKHTSRRAQKFFEDHSINWWKTPPESPDLNPIENLWHELKEFLRREIKPRTKEELVDGIHRFWDTVTVQKCTRYIRHLRKVIPRVISLNGAATGY